MNEITKFEALEMFTDSIERSINPITQSEQWLAGYVAGLRRAISMLKKTAPVTNDTQSSAKDMEISISHQNYTTSEGKSQDEPNKLGKLIRDTRVQQGITAKNLAEKLGVAKSTISEWEHGKSYPTWTNLCKLCEILKIQKINF